MRENEYETIYLTFSEIQEEFPKAAADWNWTAKMFYYFSVAGLIQRRYNHSIKSYEYEKKALIKVLNMVNSRLDERRIIID